MLRPFAFEFFRNGLLAATLAGALCGAIGCYVVLRGMSYIGHGLSHAVFGGFAVSSFVGINVFLGAGLWGLGAALLIGRVSTRRIGSDAAIAVVTTASFAFGLALVDVAGTPAKNADAALFGNVLGVSLGDIIGVLAVCVVTGAVIFLRYRALLFTSFDPQVARASGVRTGRVDALLMAVLTLAVLVSMNIMGVTLVAAAIVIPAAAARLLTQSFTTMLALATAIGAASGFIGMIASYHLDIASGPTIVLTSAGAFAAAYASEAVRHRTHARHRAAAPASPGIVELVPPVPTNS
jgi:manganese/iron transport system permease protein/iron/zinc/copper transport system permease protein